jgi:signal transduction histidine kinase
LHRSSRTVEHAPLPSAVAHSREHQVRAVGTAFLRKRPLLVAPAVAFMLLALWASDAPRAQLAVVGGIGAMVLSFFGYERWRGRTKLFAEGALLRSLVLTIVALSGLSFATGAIASPVLPLLFAPVGVGFAAFGRRRAASTIFAAFLLAVLVLFVATPYVFFPALSPSIYRLVACGALIDAALLLHVGVASLADAHARAATSLAAAGDEVVAATRARGELLESLGAKVAHEVKNPLAAIRALVELTRETADEKGRRRLDVAGTEVARIEEILRDYLSFARPMAELRATESSVDEVVGHIVAVFDSHASRAGVTLRTTGGALRWTFDPKRLKEALVNLVVNAVEATGAGGEVVIHWRADGTFLVITVKDTGKGMSASEIQKMGTPWVTGRADGSGLGVVLVRQVAEQHGGTLEYESVEGAGTTAVLRLGSLAHAPPHPRM